MPQMKRFVYAPDPHGKEVHRASWNVLMEFCADFKPDMRILGGDVFEFAPFRSGAKDDEKHQSVEADVTAGMELIDEYRTTHWTLGNHDDRLWRVRRESSGPLADYAGRVIVQLDALIARRKIQTYEYRADSFCPIGPRLKAIHGNAVNMHTAKAVAEVYGCAVSGHTHSVDYYQARAIERREAWVCGCLRNVWAEFNKSRTATLRHRHGFAFGFYRDDGPEYSVYQAASDERGRWLIPSTFREYGHGDS